jgi:drug/metabolite transporter (DMT)-like permease
MVATRHLCKGESAWTLTAVNQAGYLLLGLAGLVVLGIFPASDELEQSLPFFFDAWKPLTLVTVGIVAVIGAMNVIGHTAVGRAYQTAEASFLAPFDYSYLAFACLWSVLVWSDKLTAGNLLGMALIAGAGIFIAWRRRQPGG